jgi:hypothetical protein
MKFSALGFDYGDFSTWVIMMDTWITKMDSEILDFCIRHSPKGLLIFIHWTKRQISAFFLLTLFLWHSHAMSASSLEPLEDLGIGSGSICCWAEIFAMFCGV